MSQWLDDYSYDLPPELIAQRPAKVRDRSRMMILDRLEAPAEHTVFDHFPLCLREGDLLVLNDTFVRPARLFGRKEGTGGKVEMLLLSPLGRRRWRALVKGRCSPGTILDFGIDDLKAQVCERGDEGERVVSFSRPGGGEELMAQAGYPPLPPYIRRGEKRAKERKLADFERYQTVYARHSGSVAAPTAGLHFTAAVMKRLLERGTEIAYLTLHVGPGTFRPVRSRDVSKHKVESEFTFISAATAAAVKRARQRGGRVVAVGTTVTRALEAFAGKDGIVRGGRRRVDLVISPGYRFKVVDGILTNFHLPRSSLLLLAAAFAGRERLLQAYREAVDLKYRFYSFGDVMFIR